MKTVGTNQIPTHQEFMALAKILGVGDEQVYAARRQVVRRAAAAGCVLVIAYLTSLVAPNTPARLTAIVFICFASFYLITSVAHDANHYDLTERRVVNSLLRHSFDAFGASAKLWRQKHNQLHHMYPNDPYRDPDIQHGFVLRLSASQRWRAWHRWQHIYAWLLYGFMTQAFFVSDLTRAICRRSERRAQGLEGRTLALLWVGKLVFVGWSIVIPTMVVGKGALVVYLVCSWVVGLALAITVQLGHVVDIVDLDQSTTASIRNSKASSLIEQWVSRQICLTADVHTASWCGRTWGRLVGGLDHQAVHHALPVLPHPLYASMRHRLQALSVELGTEYHIHASLRSAIRSHANYLKLMGRRPNNSDRPTSVARPVRSRCR